MVSGVSVDISHSEVSKAEGERLVIMKELAVLCLEHF